jgi:hypothetical protein
MKAAIATVTAITHGFVFGFHAVMGTAAAAAAISSSCSCRMGLALAQEYGKLSAAEPESFRYIDAKVTQADSEIGQNGTSSTQGWVDTCSSEDAGWKIGALLLPIVELAGPVQEADQSCLLLPNEAEKLSRIDGVGLASRIGLDPPAQIFTAPWPQAMSTCGIP